MGLKISHGCYDGSFRGFHNYRTALGHLIGVQMPTVDHIPGGLAVHEFPLPAHTQTTPDALLILLEHDDDGGEISPADCIKLADRLEHLLPLTGDWEELTQDFINGLREAASENEPIRFNIPGL